MPVAATARLFLARRPWVYWAAVTVLTALIVFVVHDRMAALEAERASWGTTRRVLVADRPLAPGEPIAATMTDLPVAVIPAGAMTDLPSTARLRQRVAEGAVLVDVDVTAGPGPAAGADADTVVVAVHDELAASLTIGLAVQVAADGLVIADVATIVDLTDDVVYIAVEPADAAMVAAASGADLATLLFLP